MPYIEIDCQVSEPIEGNEILIALLSNLGCESFTENSNGFCAYINQADFNKIDFDNFAQKSSFPFDFKLNYRLIEDQNWNAVWESNYQPVLIDNQCFIRAPFHQKMSNVEFDIIIKPEMSFGTAHHQTTAQLITYLLNEDCEQKTILDMGTGTGILAILASMRKAKHVVAIDNDKWAIKSCEENAKRNQCANIEVILGDATTIPNVSFDVIIANINRNILLKDMSKYAFHLKKGGILFLSGFYFSPDLQMLINETKKYNIQYQSHKEKDDWVAARFIKQ